MGFTEIGTEEWEEEEPMIITIPKEEPVSIPNEEPIPLPELVPV